MSKFGWSYPAGCTGTPYDDEGPETCPVCGLANWNEEMEAWLYRGGPYCSEACDRFDTAANNPHTEWVMVCKRTEDPKLAWLERRLHEMKIPTRRNGASWHAPILEVPKDCEGQVWEYLGAPFDGRVRIPRDASGRFTSGPRRLETVDDVADDDAVFLED